MKNTPGQILAVLAACQAEPKFPSQVEVVGLDSFNGADQQQKQAIFDDLHSRGLLQLVHAGGRRTPLGWIITPKGAAERDFVAETAGSSCQMTSKPLTPQIGRKILDQLAEEPKRESAIVLQGFNPFDAWDSRRITGFLEALESRGLIARDPAPEDRRTPGLWRSTTLGREAATRNDFLADAE